MRTEKLERPLKILIVDDNSEDIASPYLMSTNLGYQVTLAFDGSEALASMSRENFDLVILDWNMPVMTGRDVLETMGRKSSSRPINIVLYSGNELRYEEMPEGRTFRIVDVWEKPLRTAEMLRRMKQLREKLGR